MSWQTIVALCVMVPVFCLPLVFVWFIVTDGFFIPFLKNTAKWLTSSEPLPIAKKIDK